MDNNNAPPAEQPIPRFSTVALDELLRATSKLRTQARTLTDDDYADECEQVLRQWIAYSPEIRRRLYLFMDVEIDDTPAPASDSSGAAADRAEPSDNVARDSSEGGPDAAADANPVAPEGDLTQQDS